VSFSKRRTNRRFKANVQRKRLTVDGVAVRLDICTRCMRSTYKSGKA
jgi:large subunit ribosomal protein L28